LIFQISLIVISGLIGSKVLSSRKNSLKAKPLLASKSTSTNTQPHLKKEEKEERQTKNDFLISTASMASILLGTLCAPVTLLGVIGVFYTSFSVMKRGIKSLLNDRKVGYELLLTIGIFILVSSGQYLVMAFGAWMYYLGSIIQLKAKGESKKALTNLFEEESHFVWIVHEAVEIKVPLDQLKTGDVFVVNTGEKILADGEIIKGQALIDQQLLTGEFQPAEKLEGEKVLASTVVLSGKIHIQAEKTGDQTISAGVRQMLLNAAEQKSSRELKGEEWADRSVLPVLGAASIASLMFNPMIGLFTLNNGPGGTVRFIAPIVTLNHLKIAAQSGVLIKDGCALEKLNTIDTILFDKTGTLTTAEPVLDSIVTYTGKGENEVLIYAASAESKLTHPIAHAILNEAQRRKLDLIPIDESEYKIGLGLTVLINASTIRVGSPKFMIQEGISTKDVQENLVSLQKNGHTPVLVSQDDTLIGVLEIRAQVRPEVKRLVSLFHAQKVKMYLVSGDQQVAVQSLSDTLDLDGCFYEVLPSQKADIVKQFQKEGKSVCFVGDGINDTVAMQASEVSISLKGASSPTCFVTIGTMPLIASISERR